MEPLDNNPDADKSERRLRPRGAAAPLFGRAAVTRNISFGVAMASSLVTLPWIIEALGGHWYGIWVIVGTFMGYFGVLDFGLASATIRFLGTNWSSGKEAEVRKVVSTSLYGFSMLSVISLVICSIAWFVAPEFIDNPSDIPQLRTVILIMAVNVAVALPASVFQAILTVQLRYDLIALATGVQAVLRIGLVYAVLEFGGTIVEVALITLALNLAVFMSHFAFSIRMLPAGTFAVRHISHAALKSYIGFGRFTFLTSVGDILRFRIDVVVIGFILGSVSAGIYNIALILQNMAATVVANVVGGTQPVFARYHAEGRTDLIRQKLLLITRVSTIMSVMASGTLIMLAPLFVDLWVGLDFAGSIAPLIVLAVALPFGLSQNAAVQVLYAVAKHRFYAYLTICEAIANVGLSIVLVQYWGLIGVALGTAIPIFVTKTLFLPRYVCRQVDLPLTDYVRTVVASVLMVVGLQLPCAVLIAFADFGSFWLVLPIVLFWQLLAGFVMLRFFFGDEDFSYIDNAIPMLSFVRRRNRS